MDIDSEQSGHIEELRRYADGRVNCDRPPMSYLYSSESLVSVSELVAKLTFVRLLQGEKVIEPENLLQRAAAHEAGPVKACIREYVAFVCLVNPAFPVLREEELFAASYRYYCWHLDNLFESFAFELEDWKRGFEGCLFIG